MRNRLLRSVLVAAFSTVVAFGALAGLSGAKGDVARVSGAQVAKSVAVDGGTPVTTDDSVWD
jgi:hypothetical protein